MEQRRRAARLGSLVLLVAPVAAGLLVWRSSVAAFSGTTGTAPSSVSTGDVVLADDDQGQSLFAASNLRPGSTGQRCLLVTYSGVLAAQVKLYATSITATNGVADHLNLQIEEGSGGSFATCTGFAPTSTLFNGTAISFGTTASAFGSGLGSWAPASGAPGVTRSFRLTYTLASTAPVGTANGSVQLAVTWEARNS